MPSPAEDELAIRSLVARYSDAVARRDAADWAATWAPDGEWQIMGRAVQGREEVTALWSKLIGGLSFVLQLANGGLIELDGDRATGRWYITEHGKLEDGSALLTLGVYHDEYARGPEGWCFQRRRFDVLHMGPPDLSGQIVPFPKDLS